MKTGIELISEKRREQIEEHGFDAEHDLKHSNYELYGASVFCLRMYYYPPSFDLEWASKLLKKSSYEANLINAGALISAELDRIQLLKSKGEYKDMHIASVMYKYEGNDKNGK